MPKKINKHQKTTDRKHQNKVPASYWQSILNDKRIQIVLIISFMAAVTLAIYVKTLYYPFHFDDEIHILENPNIRITELSVDQFLKIFKGVSKQRPVVMISFALNYFLSGNNAFGYHIVNILIHFLNGILLFYLIRITIFILRTCTSRDKEFGKVAELLIPFIGSLLWLSHPLHTSSVTLITQRMNIMAAFFYLSSMIFYIEARRKLQNSRELKWPFFFLSCSAFSALLAIGSKEISVTLPFFILLYEYFFFQDLNFYRMKKYFFLFLIVTTILLIIIILNIGFIPLDYFKQHYILRNFTVTQRVLTELRVVVFYITLFFFPNPSRLNLDHDFQLSLSLINPFSTLISLLIIIGLIAVSIFTAKKMRFLSFGIIWFLGNLALESSVLPLEIIYEHRTYLPSMLPCISITILIFRFLKSDRISFFILAAFTILLCFWSVDRNSVYKDPITLWTDCSSKAPGKSRPHTNLGRALAEAGENRKALIEYKKALHINPQSAITHYNAGLSHYRLGDLDKAFHHYQKTLGIGPIFVDANTLAEAHNNIGVCYIDRKKIKKGIEHYKKALELNPGHSNALGNLERAVSGLKNINNKINATQNILKKNQSDPEHLKRLAYLHYLKCDLETALDYYLKAFDTRPSDANVAYNIACIYALKDIKQESIFWLKKAISIGFDNLELIKSDKDLNNIRGTIYYKTIIN
jgi:protein O-mannosyl-transferase